METNQKPKGPLDVRSLKEAGEFTIMFDNDRGMKCQFIAADNYNLLVSSGGRKILILKHSIKYVVLE